MRSLVVGALLLGMLLTAPSADAQVPEPTYTMSVGSDDAPIVPITEARAVPYEVTVACETGTPGHTEPTAITLDVRSSVMWAVVTVHPLQHDVVLPPEECLAGTTKQVHGNVSITLSKDARAGERAMITLNADVDGEQVDAMAWNVTSGVYHKVQVQFEQAIWKAPQGATVDIPLTVANFGNSDITPAFSLANDTSEGLQIVLPEPASVAVNGLRTFVVNVTTPSGQIYENRRDKFVVEVTTTSDVDGSSSHAGTIAAVVQTQGTAAGESPIPTFVGLLALLGLCAGLRAAGQGRSKVLTTKRL